MAGHSKWAQIKRQKGAADVKRGQLFTKLAREITVAARQGGGDPAANVRLRLAIQKARDSNMPMDNIERAIKKATGDTGSGDVEETTYEGYAPGGVALLLDVMTDNRNRTVADIRSAFNKAGGTLAENGAVSWLFEQRGVITVEGEAIDADSIFLTAADAGAEDVKTDDGVVEVYTPPDRLEAVRQALEAEAVPISSAELAMIPKTTVSLDEKHALQVLKLLERLDDLDDVQRVFSNAEFPDSVLAGYS